MTEAEKIKRLGELKKEIDKLNEEFKQLSEEVKTEMISLGEVKNYVDDIEVSVVTKTTIKYTDEVGIMTYLKEHNMTNFIKETISTTDFNKQLKTSQTLKNDLKDMYVENETIAFSVKQK